MSCPVCGAPTAEFVSIRSEFSQRDFSFRHCDNCGFTFVSNPRLDFAALYDGEYYAGRGADAFVNYLEEMDNPNTIRTYEWDGILRAVVAAAGSSAVSWLDYGSGLGGLVRHARNEGVRDAWGYDEGWSAAWAADRGVPMLTPQELEARAGTFDVVTAIEVLEHISDPVGLMTQIARLLKPGGLFLLTTGNAEPHQKKFAAWDYVHPDVHVSYFEPRTLREIYRRAGMEPFSAGLLPGYEGVIRYKVLQTLRIRSRSWLERLVPWRLVSHVVDRRYKISAQPLARRSVPRPG